MGRILKFSYDHPIRVLAITLLLTVFIGYFALNLEIDVSSDSLLPRKGPLHQEYAQVQKAFGSDKIAAVYVEDGQLFTVEAVKRLAQLGQDLGALEQVRRVESLFTLNHIESREGWLEIGPLLDPIPENQDDLSSRIKQARENPLMRGNVISTKGQATLFTLYLNSEDPENVLDERERRRAEASADKTIFNEVEKVIQKYESDFDRVFQFGSPALQANLSQFLIKDQLFLLPLSGLILMLLIAITLKSIVAAVIPLANAAVTSIWTAGIMALFDLPVNMLNYIVPALILIVGATEDIHVLVEYRELRRQNKDGSSAIYLTGRRIGLTLLLTALTTVLGFSATGLTEVPVMQQFGITAGIAMAARFGISLLLLPAFLSLGKSRRQASIPSPTDDSGNTSPLDRFSSLVMDKFARRPLAVSAVFFLIAMACVFLGRNIRVSNDLISFLREDSTLYQRLSRLAFKLSGSKVVYLTLKGNEGEFKSSSKLRKVSALGARLKQIREFDSVISLADILSLVNMEMRGGEQEDFVVPASDNLIAQYLLFFHRSDLTPYITHDYSQANIIIRTSISDTTHFNELMDEIRQVLDSGEIGTFVYTLTGKSVLVSAAVDRVVGGQIYSLGGISLLLFVIVSGLFVSIRCGILAVLANLFSVAVMFGVMGLFNIPLNVGTSMIAAITLGIGIDDTLHLMVRYHRELKNLKDEHQALGRALRAEVLPVLVTSLGLAAGFVVLGASSFVPVMQFGLLGAFVLIIAVIVDLVLTPILFSRIRLITLWEILGMQLRETLRNRSPLFSGMSPWQVKKVILLSHLEDATAGAEVIREGEWGDLMYVVIDGELEVSKIIANERTVLQKLTLGDVFGEIALISKSERTADINAITDSKLLAIDWESLSKIQRFYPHLSSRLNLNLARILVLRLMQNVERFEKRQEG